MGTELDKIDEKTGEEILKTFKEVNSITLESNSYMIFKFDNNKINIKNIEEMLKLFNNTCPSLRGRMLFVPDSISIEVLKC